MTSLWACDKPFSTTSAASSKRNQVYDMLKLSEIDLQPLTSTKKQARNPLADLFICTLVVPACLTSDIAKNAHSQTRRVDVVLNSRKKNGTIQCFPACQQDRRRFAYHLFGHVNTSYLIGRAADFRGRREMDRRKRANSYWHVTSSQLNMASSP